MLKFKNGFIILLVVLVGYAVFFIQNARADYILQDTYLINDEKIFKTEVYFHYAMIFNNSVATKSTPEIGGYWVVYYQDGTKEVKAIKDLNKKK